MQPRSRAIVSLAVFITICLLIGGAPSVVTASSVRDWYPGLDKPSWTPPGWLFGPVWTALYVMMGISGWLIFRSSIGRERVLALSVFTLQLGLNSLWSFVFFGMKQPGWAALEIVALWIAIVATMVVFARIRRGAAALLLPYLAWVSFAAALNVTIWRLNHQASSGLPEDVGERHAVLGHAFRIFLEQLQPGC